MIETDRLVLRKPRWEDVESFVPIVADEETMRYLGGVRVRARVEASIARWLERWETEGFSHFVVTRRADSAFLGQVGLTVWDSRTWEQSSTADAGEHAEVEMGWMLDRAEWGKGYATEAARAALDWAYTIGVRSIVSMIHPENVTSARVAEKLGAYPAGTIVVDGWTAVLWRHRASGRA